MCTFELGDVLEGGHYRCALHIDVTFPMHCDLGGNLWGSILMRLQP